jgi:hypothetical protein
MSNARIQRLVDERELDVLPAPADEVAEFWRKALRAYADSRIEALSPENAVLLAYQAAMSAATAVVRAAGYRVKNRGRHHYVTFYTLAALGEGTPLAAAAGEMNELRGDRHVAGYGSEVDERRLRAALAELHAGLARLFPEVRAWLAEHRADVQDLPPP